MFVFEKFFQDQEECQRKKINTMTDIQYVAGVRDGKWKAYLPHAFQPLQASRCHHKYLYYYLKRKAGDEWRAGGNLRSTKEEQQGIEFLSYTLKSSKQFSEVPSHYPLLTYLQRPPIPFFFLFNCVFRAEPVAYGGSQAKDLIRAVAASQYHSHSIARSELHLKPTPQLTATLDP